MKVPVIHFILGLLVIAGVTLASFAFEFGCEMIWAYGRGIAEADRLVGGVLLTLLSARLYLLCFKIGVPVARYFIYGE